MKPSPSASRRLAARAGRVALPLVLASASAAQSVLHVRASATGANDGTSWMDAYTDLSVALGAAVAGDEVWVAAGTYHSTDPTVVGDPRSVSFVVRSLVGVYGGFDGTEASRDERAGLFAQTILSGELQGDGDPTNNAYHVVTVQGVGLLDGLVVERGYADGSEPAGGGIFCQAGPHGGLADLVLTDCTLRFNTAAVGGGFYQSGGETQMKRTRVMRNAADIGAGIAVGAARFTAYNCEIGYNAASSLGGGMRVSSTTQPGGAESVLFVNTLFHHNSAEFGGAGYLGDGTFWEAQPEFQLCTISANTASDSGGGLFAANASATPAWGALLHSIVWGNTAGVAGNELAGSFVIANSDAPGGSGVSFYSDPLFASGTFRLSAGSPCIDHGNSNLVPPDLVDVDDDGDTAEDLPIDFEGDARVLGITVDLGYDECDCGGPRSVHPLDRPQNRARAPRP